MGGNGAATLVAEDNATEVAPPEWEEIIINLVMNMFRKREL